MKGNVRGRTKREAAARGKATRLERTPRNGSGTNRRAAPANVLLPRTPSPLLPLVFVCVVPRPTGTKIIDDDDDDDDGNTNDNTILNITNVNIRRIPHASGPWFTGRRSPDARLARCGSSGLAVEQDQSIADHNSASTRPKLPGQSGEFRESSVPRENKRWLFSLVLPFPFNCSFPLMF